MLGQEGHSANVQTKLIPLIFAAVCAVSAIASTSASALQFYGCRPLVSGGTGTMYEDSRCTKEKNPGSYELYLITELLNIESHIVPDSTYTLKDKAAGVTTKIACKEQKGTGSIDNKGGLGLGLITSSFSNCTVEKPEGGCKVEEPIVAHSEIVLSTENSKDYVLFFPDLKGNPSNKIFTNIKFTTGCGSALNGETFSIEGSAHAEVENTASKVVFLSGAPNNQLIFAGNEATFTGESVVEMEGGGPIHVQ
jgi:hypothetical protein